MSGNIGLNVANSTNPLSPTNCLPLSPSNNFWNLCLFFGANVLAHAATIHPRTGATKLNSLRRMLLMLVAPITAGTVATHVLITFVLGIKQCGWKYALFLGSRENLEDAIPAGAIGIKIPQELAPVLAGRWKLVGDERHSLMLDHQKTHQPHHHPYKTSREPHIPSPQTDLEFILPPQSKIPGYKNHKFYPNSSFANELIAVVQLIYGIYQLVAEYGSQITLMGLSSPYTPVIPYLFMSLVNLLANLLMPSYSHVVILPPVPSSVVSRTSSSTTLASKGASSEMETRESKEGSEDRDIELGECTQVIRRHRWEVFRRYCMLEYEWNRHYISLNEVFRQDTRPEADGLSKQDRKKLLWQKNPDVGFITWTFRGTYFGKDVNRSSSWSRECHPPVEMERNLEEWLQRHYPGVEASIHARPLRVYQWSRYISVTMTLLVMTILLGVLTRFQFMVGEYAGRNISLIYLPPAILLVPFMVLEFKRTSVGYFKWVDAFSSYVFSGWEVLRCRIVNQLMISCYVGGMIQLGIALWAVGDCMQLFRGS
jgi:hypothetical protein